MFLNCFLNNVHVIKWPQAIQYIYGCPTTKYISQVLHKNSLTIDALMFSLYWTHGEDTVISNNFHSTLKFTMEYFSYFHSVF